MEQKEICKVILGKYRKRFFLGQLINKTIGDEHSVEFDGNWVLKREEEHGDVLGFYHTHIGNDCKLSRRDIKTMAAWIDCFNKPLLCMIESSLKWELYDFYPSPARVYFNSRWCFQIGSFIFGRIT